METHGEESACDVARAFLYHVTTQSRFRVQRPA